MSTTASSLGNKSSPSGIKSLSWITIAVLLLMIVLFCSLIFTVNSQEEKSTAATTNNVVEDIIESKQLLKEQPTGTPATTADEDVTTTLPILGEDEDDDFEDYDADDFAVLGNEWLLKEIKEIEEQIQTVSDEDVGEIVNRGPGVVPNATKSD